MKRILHLRCSGGFLGAENVVIELCENSKIFGYESIIGVPYDIEDPVPELVSVAMNRNIRVVQFKCRNKFDLSIVGNLRKFVKDENIDIIHCHGYREDLYALLSFLSIPKVATNHLWKKSNKKLKFYAFIDGILLRYFDHVIAVSGKIIKEMSQIGINTKILSLIPNGISINRFNPTSDKSSMSQIEKEFNINKAAIVLGMISSLTIEKGHALVVDCMKELVKQHPNLVLLIVGEGSEYNNINELVTSYGLKDYVKFAGKRTDIAELLSVIDVFVLASIKEGLPMALLEAMASGKAVIATDVGDVGRVVNNDTGILLERRDKDSLIDAVNELLNNTDKISLLGSNARKIIENKYTSEVMTQSYCRIYDMLLCNKKM